MFLCGFFLSHPDGEFCFCFQEKLFSKCCNCISSTILDNQTSMPWLQIVKLMSFHYLPWLQKVKLISLCYLARDLEHAKNKIERLCSTSIQNQKKDCIKDLTIDIRGTRGDLFAYICHLFSKEVHKFKTYHSRYQHTTTDTAREIFLPCIIFKKDTTIDTTQEQKSWNCKTTADSET